MILLDGKYRTRRGYPVRILSVDRADKDYPVVGLVQHRGQEYLHSWSAEGRWLGDGEHPLDLVHTPEVFWRVVLNDGRPGSVRYPNPEAAALVAREIGLSLILAYVPNSKGGERLVGHARLGEERHATLDIYKEPSFQGKLS